MEYDKTIVAHKKELAKTMAELGGELDPDDFDYLDQDNIVEKILHDAKYRYSSHTSDEDKKYVHKKNKNIMFWKNQYRRKHILKLWKSCSARAHALGMVIN
jgi:hypothetical protein